MIFDADPVKEPKTLRLYLKWPRRSDVDALDEAIRESIDALALWLPWARIDHDRSDTRRFLRGARIARSRRHTFEFVIRESASDRVVGMVSLHRIDWLRRTAGLGYWIRKTAWGRGFATEAAAAVLALGFQQLGLHRVEVHVALENKASQRVAEKLGLVREGIARESELVNGRYLDHIQYALLRTDPLGHP